MFCTHCGKQIDSSARFCIYCGSPSVATTQPVSDLATQSTAQPIAEPIAQPAAQPVAEPVVICAEPNNDSLEAYSSDGNDCSFESADNIIKNENSKKLSKENTAKLVNDLKDKYKKQSKGVKIGIIATLISAAVFLVSLIVTLFDISGTGNFLLIFTGILDGIACFVLYKVLRHRQNFTCPECGEKRIHHRSYLYTSDKFENFTGQNGFERTTYTHHYHDTYTCPKCGTIHEEDVDKYGGKVTLHYATGKIEDTRIEPKEF